MTKEARVYNGEKTVSLISGAGKTGQLQVKQLRTFSHIIYKNKLKMNRDLNVSFMSYIKLLEENVGGTLFDINCSNFFLICLLRQKK